MELLLWTLILNNRISILVSLLRCTLTEPQTSVSRWLEQCLKPHNSRVLGMEVILIFLTCFFHLIDDMRSIQAHTVLSGEVFKVGVDDVIDL